MVVGILGKTSSSVAVPGISCDLFGPQFPLCLMMSVNRVLVPEVSSGPKIWS